ncbi:MAG: glycosyltransferase family 10 [Planctomycetota bacterium]|nr:glycosyltransferase family 10 [Planctomycetota bacterium]
MTTVGLFVEHHADVDQFWEQCDEPYGHHRGIEIRPGDRDADHIFLMGLPFFPGPRPRLPVGARVAGSLKGDTGRRKLEAAWQRFGVERERTSVLFYEPEPYVKDEYYALARTHARRVYGTDARADEAITLPTVWLVEGDVRDLAASAPPTKSVPLAVVSSGKNFLPGHGPRLSFFERLREAGVPLEVFGRGLPPEVGSRGAVRSKRGVLEPARFALAIENHTGSPGYVTEKLWDALLCWCLPLYYGHPDAPTIVPPESFVRLPDLGAAGVEVVREALANKRLYAERLDAIAEARRAILGEHRMVEWIRRVVVGL